MIQNNSQKGFSMSVTITIIALAIVIAGVAYYFVQQPTEDVMVEKEGEVMTEEEGAMKDEKDDDAMMEEESGTTHE